LVQTIEQHADWVLSLAFNPDGSRLASGSRDKSARVFNVASAELEDTYSGHDEFVTAIGWPDAKSILSASRTGTAHRWNAGNGKKTGELSGWEAEPTRLLVSGTNVVTASFDRRVRQHAISTNRVIRVFSGHTDAVYSLAFHDQSRRLASGSHDGEIRIWRMEEGELLLRFVAAPGYTPKLSRTP
jgi:WD40 repeat protein